MLGRIARCGLAGGAVAASVAWSLTIPLMASPDEPAQTFAVSAAADGQFRTPFVEIPDLGRQSVVNVPRRLAQYDRYADCMMIDPTSDASCQYLQPLAETPEVEVRTQFGRYPPTYYLLVGLPSRAIDGTTSPRTMRTVSALLVGAVFGLGLWLLARYHRSAYAVPAAAVALTPAVLALGGTVNASSFEVATAFAAWCGVACLASRDDLPRPLCWWTTVSLSLLIVSRPVSPLWAAIILVVLMVHRGRDLVRERSIRWCLAPLAVAGAGWVAWTGAMGTPPLLGQPPDRTGLRPALGIIRRALPERLTSLTGNFLGTHPPTWVPTVFAGALLALVLIALRANRRGLVTAGSVTLVCAVASTLLELGRYADIGPWWQARYSLPLLVGVPLLVVTGLTWSLRRLAAAAMALGTVATQVLVIVWYVGRFR